MDEGKGKVNKAKAIWCDAEDAIITEALKSKVETMTAGDNGFTPSVYKEIADRCNSEVPEQKGPSKTGEMASTRYHYVSVASETIQASARLLMSWYVL